MAPRSSKLTKKNKKEKNGRIAKQKQKIQKIVGGRRTSSRIRTQTILHQAPTAIKKPTPKKLALNKRKIVDKSSNEVTKKQRIEKKIKKENKNGKKSSKKGNDRLVARNEVPSYQRNPFFENSKIPEIVSTDVHHRWLIRAIRKQNLNEIKAFFKSNRVDQNSFYKPFSYQFTTNAIYAACKSNNQKIIDEVFKQIEHFKKIENYKLIKEANLLKYKSSGRSNVYMIGRATRHVEMARGGREGNNALLNYAQKADQFDENGTLNRLVQDNEKFELIFKLCKSTEEEFQEYMLARKIVVASRMGHRSLACSIAQGPAKNSVNDLLIETLKSNKLPDKILAASAMKKLFENRNITPIHTAAIYEKSTMLETLRRVCPNINIPDQDNWYTMHYAAVSATPDSLEYLLKNGGSVTVVNKRQETLLHVAARAGRAENIKLIIKEMLQLEKGENGESMIKFDKSLINARSRNGLTALHLAVIWNRIDVVRVLLTEPSVLIDHPSSTGTNNTTPLMLACGNENIEMVKELISHGALIEAKDKKRRTPLIHSFINGQIHIAAHLLSLGAIIFAADSSGNTSAHYSAAYGFLDGIQLLAEIDKNILSQENDWKLLPVSVAYLKGHYGIVKWLFDSPYKNLANINAKDITGATLLSSLLSYSDENYHNQLDTQIKYLIDKGADSSIQDSDGMTALHYFSSMKIVLKGSGEIPNIDATRMNIQQYKKIFKYLINSGGDVKLKDNQNNTPIHYSLINGNLELFKMMLENVENKIELFKNWSTNSNILHQILILPMKLYSTRELWKSQHLIKSNYDVLPIIKDWSQQYNSLLIEWINEKNEKGLTPLVLAVEEYSKLKDQTAEQKMIKTEFISAIMELFDWILALNPDQLIQSIKKDENSEPIFLPILAMNIIFENDKNKQNNFAFFKLLIDRSIKSKKLKELLKLTNKIGDNLLIVAITSGKQECVELILEVSKKNGLADEIHTSIKQFEIINDEKIEVKKTILMLLIENGMSDLISKIVAPNSYWNLKDYEMNNIWHYAARINNHKTISIFKQIQIKNVEIIENNEQQNPLHIAAIVCDGSANSVIEPIQWLIKKCSTSSVDKYGRIPLFYSFGTDNELNQYKPPKQDIDPIAMVSLLSSGLNEIDLNRTSQNGYSLLHFAALSNSQICIKALIRKGCHHNLLDINKNTPLGLALLYKKKEASLTLLQEGEILTANINDNSMIQTKANSQKISSNEKYVWIGKEEVKKEIFSSSIGAQIVENGNGWEAVVYVLFDIMGDDIETINNMICAAFKSNQLNIANELLKKVEFYHQSNHQVLFNENVYQTFVKFCSGEFLDESIEKILLDRILSIKNQEFLAQYHLDAILTALKHGKWSFIDYLKKKMGNEWQNLVSFRQNTNILEPLIEHMGNHGITQESIDFLKEFNQLTNFNAINQLMKLKLPYKICYSYGIESHFELPPISWAILNKNIFLTNLLYQNGAKLNICDEKGRTPLFFAISTNNIDLIAIIIGNGKEVLSTSKKREEEEPKKRSAQIMLGQLALATGVFPNQEDNEELLLNNSEEDRYSEEPPVKKTKVQIDSTEINETKNKIVITNIEIFKQKDKNGRNALHYLVEPFSYENVELLNAFAQSKPSLIKSLLLENSNETPNWNPIELAALKLNRKMKENMLKITGGIGIKNENCKNSMLLYHLKPMEEPIKDIDYCCSQFLSNWSSKNDKIKENKPKPHQLSSYQNSGQIVFDDENNQYFNVLLNKTDLNYGRYGFHNFYRMQLIKRNDCDLWILFTNWGRIGAGSGENQTTPFKNIELAKKEFKSVFKSKTGNDWKNLENFRDENKKYRLVRLNSSPKTLAEIDIKHEWIKQTEAHLGFIQDICNFETLKNYAKQVAGYNNTNQFFGRLTKENVKKAKEILEKLEENAKEIEKMLKSETSFNESKLLEFYTFSNNLSSEYYSLIPTGNCEFSNLSRLDTIDDIANQRKILNRYEEIEVATRILCAAEYLGNKNRLNNLYISIGCQIVHLPPNKCQHLLQWIHNSSNQQFQVETVFQIEPKQSVSKFEPFMEENNHQFLFHGTKATNLISILKNGFLVDPQNACRNGQLFGPGVYLADSFSKSAGYCEQSHDGLKYMIVCQVALGKVRELFQIPRYFNSDQHKKKLTSQREEDTIHYIGQKYPSGCLTIDGVAIPFLEFEKKEETENWQYGTLEWSEYIVRNPDRVLPRFIIGFK